MQFSVLSLFSKDSLASYNDQMIVALVSTNKRAIVVINFLLPLLLSSALLDIAPIIFTIVWLGLHSLIVAMRLMTAKKLLQAIEVQAKNKLSLLNRYINILSFTGLVWGLAVAFIVYVSPNEASLLGIIFIFGLAAGSVSTLGTIFHGFIRFLLALLLPVLLVFTVADMPYSFGIGVAFILFCYFVIMSARQNYDQFQALFDLSNKLTEEKNRSEAANQAKSDFLANMSHEIRTPLNGVVGLTELLLRNSLSSVQEKRVKLIKESVNALRFIINDILDFSKIEAGKLELETIEFDLNKALELIVEAQLFEAQEKGLIMVKPKLDNNEIWLKGDPYRLRQILTNLVNNAIKFTHEGEIRLKVKLINKDDNTCQYRFSVEDTGIGMTENQLSQIFKKFTQADTTTTREYGGTGLGLSITKQLIELMNGEISITSVEGKGSTATCIIAFEKGTSIESDVDLEIDDHFNAQILLVEDNMINQEVAKQFLDDLGCNPILASNGEEALKLLENHTFDLVFMDCQMPKMDGYEASRLIRQESKYEKIPIVAMTANAMKGDKEKCLAAGMDDFMSKPIDTPRLKRILEQWLPK